MRSEQLQSLSFGSVKNTRGSGICDRRVKVPSDLTNTT